MSAETAELVPVRSTGKTTHRVRGIGVHEHSDFRTDDDTHIQVTRWPTAPHRAAQVVVTRPDGRVTGHNENHSSLISVGGLLRMAGYRICDD